MLSADSRAVLKRLISWQITGPLLTAAALHRHRSADAAEANVACLAAYPHGCYLAAYPHGCYLAAYQRWRLTYVLGRGGLPTWALAVVYRTFTFPAAFRRKYR